MLSLLMIEDLLIWIYGSKKLLILIAQIVLVSLALLLIVLIVVHFINN